MLLGFKKRFKPKIEDGSKIFTLRKKPKRMPKIGETLHMYVGLRTKFCTFITRNHTLKSMQEAKVVIHVNDSNTGELQSFTLRIFIDNKPLPERLYSHFVVSDGFDGIEDFVEYWTDGFKEKDIESELVQFHWTDFKY